MVFISRFDCTGIQHNPHHQWKVAADDAESIFSFVICQQMSVDARTLCHLSSSQCGAKIKVKIFRQWKVMPKGAGGGGQKPKVYTVKK